MDYIKGTKNGLLNLLVNRIRNKFAMINQKTSAVILERGLTLKLKELADLLMVKRTEGNMNIEITGLQMDSRKVEQGNLFICVPAINGFLKDRHDFAKDAIRNGAVALVVERDVDTNLPKIFVNDARHAMAVIATHFFNYPSNEMKLIGITGCSPSLKAVTLFLTPTTLNEFSCSILIFIGLLPPTIT